MKEDLAYDCACVLHAGEHPFVVHDSYVVYAKAVVWKLESIEKRIKSGEIVPKSNLAEPYISQRNLRIFQLTFCSKKNFKVLPATLCASSLSTFLLLVRKRWVKIELKLSHQQICTDNKKSSRLTARGFF